MCIVFIVFGNSHYKNGFITAVFFYFSSMFKDKYSQYTLE